MAAWTLPLALKLGLGKGGTKAAKVLEGGPQPSHGVLLSVFLGFFFSSEGGFRVEGLRQGACVICVGWVLRSWEMLGDAGRCCVPSKSPHRSVKSFELNSKRKASAHDKNLRSPPKSPEIRTLG